MKTRTLLAPAALALLTLLPLAGAHAAVPPGGDASMTVEAEPGNAPDPIDITNVHVFKTTADYRAVVTYTDLKPRKATRWYVGFLDPTGLTSAQRAAAKQMVALGQPPTEYKANVVEFRVSPSGRESSFGYKLNATNAMNPALERATCTLPQRAVANYDANTITYIVPRRCWKPTSGSAVVFTAANEYTPETWNPTSTPVPQDGQPMDQTNFGWTYRTPVIG